LAPPGTFDPGTRVGWRTRELDHAWTFVDRTGATGMRSIVVRRLDTRSLHVTARAQRPLDIAPGASSLRVVMDFPGAACALLAFPSDHCTSRAADRFMCR
jgi:hypothetical protein